ncbi:MAG: hypothetical protein LBT48_02055 [Prevotellaceae bacterium]|jgi:hypothetical protein|nr:hypothetical protein [Prevotellaceae bacterium]
MFKNIIPKPAEKKNEKHCKDTKKTADSKETKIAVNFNTITIQSLL